MRKIEQAMINAIKAGQSWSLDNTQVTVNTREDGARITSVYLHGNLIAQNGTFPNPDCWGFCLCGWNTPTTRSRINRIIEAIGKASLFGVAQRQHKPRLAVWTGASYKMRSIPSNGWFYLIDKDQ